MTPQLVASVLDQLRGTLQIYGLHLRFATANAAGSTWKVFDLVAEHPVTKVILSKLRCKYELLKSSIKIIHECPVLGEWIILLPDMPHLVKCIVTSPELGSKKDLKHDLK